MVRSAAESKFYFNSTRFKEKFLVHMHNHEQIKENELFYDSAEDVDEEWMHYHDDQVRR